MIPAGHYREGRITTVDLAVVHTAEFAGTAATLRRYFETTDRQVSCHSIVDATTTVQVLPFTDTAYAAPGANADGDQLELCGFARWNRATWLGEHRPMLERTSHWLAARCVARRLPPVLLTPADLRAGKRGITGHLQVSQAFHRSSHTDPGAGFPWDVVLARTRYHLERLTSPPAVRPLVTAPAYPGFPLTVGKRGQAVLLWQRQMRRRGWRIGVDGIYGEGSATVARAFQREKHLKVDGIVGPTTWAATWRASVT